MYKNCNNIIPSNPLIIDGIIKKIPKRKKPSNENLTPLMFSLFLMYGIKNDAIMKINKIIKICEVMLSDTSKMGLKTFANFIDAKNEIMTGIKKKE